MMTVTNVILLVVGGLSLHHAILKQFSPRTEHLRMLYAGLLFLCVYGLVDNVWHALWATFGLLYGLYLCMRYGWFQS